MSLLARLSYVKLPDEDTPDWSEGQQNFWQNGNFQHAPDPNRTEKKMKIININKAILLALCSFALVSLLGIGEAKAQNPAASANPQKGAIAPSQEKEQSQEQAINMPRGCLAAIKRLENDGPLPAPSNKWEPYGKEWLDCYHASWRMIDYKQQRKEAACASIQESGSVGIGTTSTLASLIPGVGLIASAVATAGSAAAVMDANDRMAATNICYDQNPIVVPADQSKWDPYVDRTKP